MDHTTPEKEKENTNTGNETPEKVIPENHEKENITTPKKESTKSESVEFKTPEKSVISPKTKKEFLAKKVDENRTPQKISRNIDLEGESKLDSQCDGEEGMISTTEQARLLIAASKTPSKSVQNRTPVKQNTPSGKRSLEGSPITPGKFRRVELITLSSPKAKRLKQM